MFETSTSHPSPNEFWPDSTSGNFSSNSISLTKKRRESQLLSEFLSSVDEAPDFHDPYSDLSLFLSQKIKQEMGPGGFAKKWSLKIQEELIQKISPEFQKKFPQYRLGVFALKKTWEKIAYYSQQIQNQKGAITQDGKLNIHFFIKENLRQYSSLACPSDFHPYHYAHQLAVKMSECIATVDGERIKLDPLTKMVWAVQRHLVLGISLGASKSPYDEYDKIDKLIVKTILDIISKEPQICQRELEFKVKESLQSLHELPSFASLDAMTSNISALLAEKLYPTSSFHTSLFDEQKLAVSNFFKRQTSLCKTSNPNFPLSELIRRTLALYALSSQLPKTLSREEIKGALLAMYPHTQPERPPLPQSIYAFISAELVLMKNEEYCHSIDYVVDTICQAYEETKYLPQLKDKEADVLEIVLWKILSEKENLLENLPYRIGQRIEEEIANTLIDNPHQSFASIVHLTVQFFQRLKELALHKKWAEIERKIHTWSIQSDMLCRSIRLDTEAPLYKMIDKNWNSSCVNHRECISEISQNYLKQFPELAPYTPQLISRIRTLYKYIWYTKSSREESSFDRFIKWHASHLFAQSPHLTQEQVMQQMEDLCKKMVPLLPFDAARCKTLLFSKQEPNAQSDERDA